MNSIVGVKDNIEMMLMKWGKSSTKRIIYLFSSQGVILDRHFTVAKNDIATKYWAAAPKQS